MKIISEKILKNIQLESDEVALVFKDENVIITKISNVTPEFIDKINGKDVRYVVKPEESIANKPIIKNGESKERAIAYRFDIKSFETYLINLDSKYQAPISPKDFLNYYYKNLYISKYTGKTDGNGEKIFSSTDCFTCYHSPEIAIREVVLDSFGRMWADKESAAEYYNLDEDIVSICIRNHSYTNIKIDDKSYKIAFLVGNVFPYATSSTCAANMYTDLLELQVRIGQLSKGDMYLNLKTIDKFPTQNVYNYSEWRIKNGISN